MTKLLAALVAGTLLIAGLASPAAAWSRGLLFYGTCENDDMLRPEDAATGPGDVIIEEPGCECAPL